MAKKKTTIQEEPIDTTPEIEDQEGVEEVDSEDVEQDEEEEKEPVVLERDRMIKEMAEKRRREREGSEEEQEEEEDDESGEPDDDEDEEILNLKVDGEIIPMPKREVEARGGVAEVQKVLAAEKRLHQASIQRKQLEQAAAEQKRKEQALMERERQLEARLKALEEKTKQPEVNNDEIVDKFVQSVYSGDEDEAKQSLRSLLNTLKKPDSQPAKQINEKEILDRAFFEFDRKSGLREFGEKYPHLKEDAFFFDKTNFETIQIMKENPEMSPRDVIMEAAARIDKQYKERYKGQGMDTLEQRKESKRKLEPLQSAQTRKKTETGYKKKSKEDLFDEIRKRRAK